jgi:fumarylacetoacetate (FAA) hydrolase family protein
LPDDGTAGALVGRVWLPDARAGRGRRARDGVFDVSTSFSTVSALCEQDDPGCSAAAAKGTRIGDLESILANTPPDRRDRQKPWLLAPARSAGS